MKLHSIMGVKTSCSQAVFFIPQDADPIELQESILAAWRVHLGRGLPEWEYSKIMDLLDFCVGWDGSKTVKEIHEGAIPGDFRGPLADAISNGVWGQE
jgi:hypothetical protein